MEELSLQVEIRKPGTGGALNAGRAAHKIPGVVYGGEKPSVSLLVEEKDLRRVRANANAIVTLKHEQGADTVLLKEVQRHPVNRKFMHVDFQRISLKKEIEVEVPVKTSGEAKGVKLQGGQIEHVLRKVSIKCLPTAIPEALIVDITNLEMGHAMHVSDLIVPAGITMLTRQEQVLISVIAPKVEEAPAVAAAVPGAAEPEVLAKGKKDEEGAVAEKGKEPEKGKAGGEKK